MSDQAPVPVGPAPVGADGRLCPKAQLVTRPAADFAAKAVATHLVECFGADGSLKWREEIGNLTVTEGVNALITNTFKTIPGSVTWYVGLKGAGSPAAGDTMASHAGWSEVTPYSQANRPTLTFGTVASGSVDNSASVAVFSINVTGPTTVAGLFVTSNNTKAGTTGTLYGASDFSLSRSVTTGDTINATVTITVTGT